MDINSLMAPAVEFSSTGIGQLLVNVMQAIWAVFWPSNAPAATNVQV
ncbi:hypothetical protein QVA66_08010 [Staphylococcus chromogenes]|nr:hypothetical protein [Staphylococcus chromogenes]